MKYLVLFFLSLGVFTQDINTENNVDTLKQIEDVDSNDVSPATIKSQTTMEVVDPPIERNVPILIDNTQDHGNVRVPNIYGS